MADQKPIIQTGLDMNADFRSAVEQARAAVRVVASRLQEDLDQARRFVPSSTADRAKLLRKVDEALALGVEIHVNGRRSTKLTMKSGSPAWRIGSSGSAGFQKYQVVVSVPEPKVENTPEP